MGQLDRLRTELPESAEPLAPRRWAELNTVTIAFGHGLSVAPLQAVAAITRALMNGGRLIPPTFLKRSEQEAMALAKQVIKPDTSDKMRYLMRLNVEKGSATRADVKKGYCRWQDWHLREGGGGPLFQDQGADLIHRGVSCRSAALST
jgi:cell division protein FtsI (penicillin-binding protein 3)